MRHHTGVVASHTGRRWIVYLGAGNSMEGASIIGRGTKVGSDFGWVSFLSLIHLLIRPS